MRISGRKRALALTSILMGVGIFAHAVDADAPIVAFGSDVSVLGLSSADIGNLPEMNILKGYLEKSAGRLWLYASKSDAIILNRVHAISLDVTYDHQLAITNDCSGFYTSMLAKIVHDADLRANQLHPHEIARYELNEDGGVEAVQVCWRESGKYSKLDRTPPE